MSKVLTEAEALEARRICKEATAGPWSDERHDAWGGGNAVRDSEDDLAICRRANDADNDFIAAARTGWPRALDTIDALRAEVKRLEGEVSAANWRFDMAADIARETLKEKQDADSG